MQVYHGSYTEIFEIDLSKSQLNKDFGKGFYITKFRKHAESWAINIARRYHKEPFITEFTFFERAFEEDRYKTLRHEKTHQICFCTVNSLQLLKKVDTKYSSYVVRISEPVIENLITDLEIADEKAADVFYSSKTFSLLSDKTTELYKKDWQEIYQMLKNELNI